MKAKLKCQFESCSKIVPYESFRAHADSCPENPENKVKCEMCSQEFHQNQIASHMWVLRFLIILKIFKFKILTIGQDPAANYLILSVKYEMLRKWQEKDRRSWRSRYKTWSRKSRLFSADPRPQGKNRNTKCRSCLWKKSRTKSRYDKLL